MLDVSIRTAAELDAVLADFLRKFRYVDFENIRSVAAGFCKIFDLKYIPRNPFTIFPEVLGIKLEHTPCLPRVIPAQWGYSIDGDHYLIQYTEHRSHECLSMSLWHEMGEMLLNHPECPHLGKMTSDIEDRLANLFAVHVLMPEKAVRKIAAELGHPHIQDKTITLAHRFGVSIQAMRHRLKELHIDYRYYDQPR